MALIHCEFYSEALERKTCVYVVLPEYRDIKEKKEKLKTLYLFHGLSDDYTKWARRTGIEKYAADGDWAVIMPDAEKSFYSNTSDGEKYWDYISEELPRRMKAEFPLLSDRKEDCFVAGLSMGGYGAMKLALNFPERFCAAASFSGALNPEKDLLDEPELAVRIYGSLDKIRGTENDLFYQMKKCKEEGKEIPRLYISCGTEDFIYEESQEFCKSLKEQGIPHTYEEWQGKHDWIFWEASVKRVLEWFVSKEA